MYGVAVGVVALYLATPGVPVNTRLKGLARRALPSMLASEIATGILLFAVSSSRARGGFWADHSPAVLNAGVSILSQALPIAIWFPWAKRVPHQPSGT